MSRFIRMRLLRIRLRTNLRRMFESAKRSCLRYDLDRNANRIRVKIA